MFEAISLEEKIDKSVHRWKRSYAMSRDFLSKVITALSPAWSVYLSNKYGEGARNYIFCLQKKVNSKSMPLFGKIDFLGGQKIGQTVYYRSIKV